MFQIGNQYGRPRSTHCKRGHERTPENIISSRNNACRTCHNMRKRWKYEFNPKERERKKNAARAYRKAFREKMGFWPSELYPKDVIGTQYGS